MKEEREMGASKEGMKNCGRQVIVIGLVIKDAGLFRERPLGRMIGY